MIHKILPVIFAVVLFACGTKVPETVKAPEVSKPEVVTHQKKIYKGSYTKYFDLNHTRLNVSFDWKKKQLNGKVAIILHPHFYDTDSLILNARGMDLHEVALLSANNRHIPLAFSYDSLLIRIHLDRVYSKDESLTLFINYTAKPEDLPENGSVAIEENRGLYFIDADSLNPDKPTQVWTQGESESNSAWFPTIEDPGQKMTQEIYITVDSAMTTLSNGLLISSVNNNDGTKTDYWKQSLPAAPYLTMIAAGNYSIVKDKWRNIDVDYYVDPDYEKYAHIIFGNTPEMIEYFSNLLGVPYPWEKYSQVVVYDYVSGAMENTSAVVHGTNMQQDSREHADYNYEDYISHELFHHWFGDLVTCESWSNLPLNEGFANYSEYLWREYKFGKDDADKQNQSELTTYLFVANNEDPPAFRTDYDDPENLLDAVTYNKSGRILHMLRKQVGDTAFFASLHDYLMGHLFSTAEISDLRMSFEKITGEDLNWFFNQWFIEPGHPVINIDYDWSDSLHTETITIKQKQDLTKCPLYRLPMFVDVYVNGKVERKKIVVDDVEQKFTFKLAARPDLVNVDAEKSLLCNKTDNKSNSEYIYQYDHAPLYLDRLEAVSKVGAKYSLKTPEAGMMMRALNDKFYGIRAEALKNISELALNAGDTIKDQLIKLATRDSSGDVREKAIATLGRYYHYSEYSKLFADALNDSSYKVIAKAFNIISEKDSLMAREVAPALEKDSSDYVLSELADYYSNFPDDKTDFYIKAVRLSGSYYRYKIIRLFCKYITTSSNVVIIKKSTNYLMERANRLGTKKASVFLMSKLKEIETSLEKRISEKEEETNHLKEPKQISDKKSEVAELTSLKKNLHKEIVSLDK